MKICDSLCPGVFVVTPLKTSIFPHPGFGIDSQSVCHAVNVVEIPDQFDCVQNVRIGKTNLPQRLHITLSHLGGCNGELVREIAERSLPFI